MHGLKVRGAGRAGLAAVAFSREAAAGRAVGPRADLGLDAVGEAFGKCEFTYEL